MTATANSTENLVERYIALYKATADRLGPVKRFYTSWTDEAQDIAWQVQEITGDDVAIIEALRPLYTGWLEQMTREQRSELFSYNRSLPGDQQDVILGEELEDRYA